MCFLLDSSGLPVSLEADLLSAIKDVLEDHEKGCIIMCVTLYMRICVCMYMCVCVCMCAHGAKGVCACKMV